MDSVVTEQVRMHLAIRADGGPEIGYGHLVRSGALAEESVRDAIQHIDEHGLAELNAHVEQKETRYRRNRGPRGAGRMSCGERPGHTGRWSSCERRKGASCLDWRARNRTDFSPTVSIVPRPYRRV
jgi:hypothetical protein